MSRLAWALPLLLWCGRAHAEPPAAPKLDRAPALTHFVEAVPPDTLAEHERVEVILTIDVDDHGKVQSVAVATPSPFPAEGYDEAAVAAAKQFEFTPGQSAGKPVPVRITYAYRFLYKAPPPPLAPAVPPEEKVPLGGVVKSKGDRVPLGGVTIILDDDEARKTVTDAEGRFAFPAVPIGPHKAKLRGTSITNADLKLTLSSNKRLEVVWYVAAKTRYTSTVRGQRVVQETVEISLSGDELRRIPGTQGDTLKAVQNLPGVARAPFGGGQIVVWGSAPGDTRTYVDGVFIPTLFHFFGLRSTVNSEIVQSLNFYPGGYGAEHGRGMGGVIEIESRKPRSDGYHGFVQIDLIDASLMFEAKITKTLSIAVAARRSLLDTWLPALTTNDFQLSPTYYDYQAKLSWRPSGLDELDLFVFGSDDELKLIAKRPDPALSAAVDSHIFFHRLLARYTHRFGKSSFTITPSIGYDVPFQFKATIGNTNISIDAQTIEYSLRAAAHVPLYSFLRLDAGIDFEGSRYDINGQSPASGQPREGDRPGFRAGGAFVATDSVSFQNFVAPYVALNFSLLGKRLTIAPQLRIDLYSLAGYLGTPSSYNQFEALPEPRLAARYQFVRWAAIKGAIGVYHQAPDPGSLLAGFGNTKLVPSTAIHYVLGADFDPTPTLHLEVQGFYKDLRGLIVRGKNPTDPVLQNDGVGRVYGGELLVRQELWHNFFGWIAYTLSRSERQDHPSDPYRLFQWDQTHILTVVASYKLPRGFQVGIRFRYVTGNPSTPVVGSYFDSNSAAYRPIAGPEYSTRLADFHQLDLRVDKTWTYNLWKLSVYLDIQNVYNYRSEEGTARNFDFTMQQPITGLPIVPALGIRGEL